MMEVDPTMEGLVKYRGRNLRRLCIYLADWLGDPTVGELVLSMKLHRGSTLHANIGNTKIRRPQRTVCLSQMP